MFGDEKYGYIKGLSERRRFPLLGKIRLGVKKQKVNAKGEVISEYPTETDYFVCPDEVKKLYGEAPKELDILLPVEAKHAVFPQAYRHYGSSKGLKCIGNGETALERVNGEMKERECPCEKLDNKQCCKRGFLMVILPKVSMGGVYQLVTSSYNSIIDINSGIDYVTSLLGRASMVPLKLKREKTETHHDGKKQTHYTLKIIFDGSAEFVNQLRENTKRILLEQQNIALPAPKDENPEFDPADVIESAGIKDEEAESTGKPSQDTPQHTQEAQGQAQDTEKGIIAETEENSKITPNTRNKQVLTPEQEYAKALVDIPELNGIHLETIAKKIKLLLENSGYLKKKDKYGKNYEWLLINGMHAKATKYSDLTREQLTILYARLLSTKGNPEPWVLPF